MYAELVGEPWCLSIQQIAELTDRQIMEIYRHERDGEGKVKYQEDDSAPTPPMTPEQTKAVYFAINRALGVPLKQVQKRWEAQQRKQGK